MRQVDWYYHRKNCKTCAKADAFLAEHSLSVHEQVDCKKQPMGPEEVRQFLSRANQVFAVRGTAVRRFDAPLPEAEVLAAILGPTGNLRAPSLLQNGRLFVGFEEGLYLALTT